MLPLLGLACWQFFAVRWDNPALLPRVDAVAYRLAHPFTNLLNTGSLAWHMLVSAVRVVIGFACACLIGLPLGLLAGRSLKARAIIGPFVELLRPLCPIAWIPFALVLFKTHTIANLLGSRYGLGILSHLQLGMLFVIGYGGFFPVFLNTVHGADSMKAVYLESARLLGANRWTMLTRVTIPAALPLMLTGMRIGLGISWMVIIAAEMMPGSDAGLGYLIMYSYELAEMDMLIAGIVLIGVFGGMLGFALRLISDRVSGWQSRER